MLTSPIADISAISLADTEQTMQTTTSQLSVHEILSVCSKRSSLTRNKRRLRRKNLVVDELWSEQPQTISSRCTAARIPVEIRGWITNAYVDAFTDSCAGAELIGEKLCARLRIPINRRNNSVLPNIVTVDGKEFRPIGSAKFYINVAGQRCEVHALVVQKLVQELILGTNWLKQNDAVLDFQNREFCMGKGSKKCVTMKLGDKVLPPRQIPLLTSDQSMIQGFGVDVWVRVHVPKAYREVSDMYRGMLMPSPKAGAKLLYLQGGSPWN
jgi:hypothetical protein